MRARTDQEIVPPPRQTAPARERRVGLLRDFCAFLWEAKWWWLAPIVIAALLIGWLAWLTTEPDRPPTYPSF